MGLGGCFLSYLRSFSKRVHLPTFPTFQAPRWMKLRLPTALSAIQSEPPQRPTLSRLISSEDTIVEHLLSNFSTSPETRVTLEIVAEHLFKLYPDDPAKGCPFNTGNETFGLSPQYKRAAAISMSCLVEEAHPDGISSG
ncbi:hypothetical protein B0H19DRAFT_1092089 [Mycena capillaripes]|nr:hypothetical protein B0H19DRAFT_1092089 [Mycena capillaripes]